MSNTDYWIIIIFGVVAVVGLLAARVALDHEQKKSKVLQSRVDDLQAQISKNLPYYVNAEDRKDIANFVGSHLDDVSHPNRKDMVRILANWSSVDE